MTLEVKPSQPEIVVSLCQRTDVSPLLSFDRKSSWLEKFGLTESTLHQLLYTARGQVLSMGVGDAAAQIGEVVSQLFVAKMFYVQDRLGLPNYASVVQPPDATIQTFYLKFIRCVPEAARISWANAPEVPFIPAELDVDFCGMVGVGLEKQLDAVTLTDNIINMKDHLRSIQNVEVDTNCIQPGNHFANIYKVLDHERLGLPPFMGVSHMASDEYRDLLRQMMAEKSLEVKTPFGTCFAMLEQSAQSYWDLAQEGSQFAQTKRKIIANEIFGSDHLLTNEAHYEMIGPTSCIIGCNRVGESQGYHFIASKASGKAYLVRGRIGVQEDFLMEQASFISDSLKQELKTLGVLPHGTGHKLLEDDRLEMVRLTPSGILYGTKLQNGGQRMVYNYYAVPSTSRDSVFANTEKFGLIDKDYAVLEPLCSVKV